MKMVNNIRINNDLFRKYLLQNALTFMGTCKVDVWNKDNEYIHNDSGNIISSLEGLYSIYLQNKSILEFNYNGEPNYFIEQIVEYLMNNGSFNIGICTGSEVDYYNSKIKYNRIIEKITAKYKNSNYDYIPILCYEGYIEKNKVYVLLRKH